MIFDVKFESWRAEMNTLHLTYAYNNRLNYFHGGTGAFHTNRKIFTFIVTFTYSSAPPNVNTFFL